MTEYSPKLSLAFLKSHPEEAANILEQLDVNQVANFLTNVDEANLQPVLGALMPHYLSRILKVLDVQKAAQLLLPLAITQAVSVLRYLDKPTRTKVINHLPTKNKKAFNRLLRFSQYTAGAWMSSNALIITLDETVEDLVEKMISSDSTFESDCIFVVSRDKKLQGRLYFSELLAAKSGTNIDSLIKHDTKSIASHLPLEKVIEDECWEQYDVVPVHSSSKQIIGALRYKNVRKGLDHLATYIKDEHVQDPISGIFSVYGQTLIKTVETMLNSERKNSH